MIRVLRSHASYANVAATLALVLAMAGGAVAAKSTINGKEIKKGTITAKQIKKKTLTGKQVKPDSLKGTQIKESTLGQVPSALNADGANTAVQAESANDAAQLGGDPATSFVQKSEGFHTVGATDEPAFQSGFNAGLLSDVQFWKDGDGMVHLRGNTTSGTANDGDPIFTLPPGYRPVTPYADFVVAGAVGTFNTLSINASGEVFWFAGTGDRTYTSLEGVEFPAS